MQAVVQAFADATGRQRRRLDGHPAPRRRRQPLGDAPLTDTDVAPRTAPRGRVTGTYGNYGGGGTQIPEAGNQIVDWDGAAGQPGDQLLRDQGRAR